MRTDRYTKVVLTVIAACLVWQCAMAAGRVVEAQQSQATITQMTDAAKPVIVVGWGEMNERGEVVNIYTRRTPRGIVTDPVASVRLPYTVDSPLPVGVAGNVPVVPGANRPFDVSLAQVQRSRAGGWDPVVVKVEPAGTSRTPGEIR